MLDAIFSSIPRTKILGLLLLSPEKSYQIEQLAISLNLSAVSLRHELNNLVKFGLIQEEKVNEYQNEPSLEKHKPLLKKPAKSKNKNQKEKKIYKANVNFLLYPEIKDLFVKAQILFSQKFIDNLQKVCQIKFLALTGIFTNYPEARTDILLVASIRRSAFLKILQELEKDLGREINFTILSIKEFHYREDVMDIFLYNILTGKTLTLLDNIHKSA